MHIWDELRSVDGTDVSGLEDEIVADLVRGPSGTTVTLGLVGTASDGRTGQERSVTLERGFEAPGAEVAR